VDERIVKGWQTNKYLWMTLLFVAVYILLASRQGKLSVSIPVACGIFALAIVNAAARTWSAWTLGGANDDRRSWFFNLIDIALISAAVHVTGGIESELWLLYMVLFISEALYATYIQTRLVLAILCLCYLAVTLPAQWSAAYALTLASRLFFLVLVAQFARRLAHNREARNRELAALQEQIAASEERARIAREVHDGLGHALVSVILRLELCLRLLKRDPAQAEEMLKEEIPALRAAWNEGRDLAFHLRPWESDPAGFAPGLRRHLSRFAERTGIAVEMQITPENLSLPAEAEMGLTRILQEALTNIARHSRASGVTVNIAAEGRRLRCMIRDNGVGFAPEAQAGGFGLNAMRERAERLGGQFELSSRPQEGTTIEVTLPL
jgi:signal transduction histidine kinase